MPLIECTLPTEDWALRETDLAGVLTKPVSAPSLRDQVARALPRHGGVARIVVLDDDRGFVRLVTRMLESEWGALVEVIPAYNGRDGLTRITRVRPDLVLLDLVMPEMTGFEVLAAMRLDPALAETPVVAITAATPGEDEVAAQGARFSVRRRGGFQPGETCALLEHALGLAAAGTSLEAI